MIQLGEEAKVLAARQPSVKTKVSSCVIANLATDSGRFANCVVTRKSGGPASGKQQRGKNAKQSRFTRAIGAQQCDGFSPCYLETDSTKGWRSGPCKGLEERTPPAKGWRKPFF